MKYLFPSICFCLMLSFISCSGDADPLNILVKNVSDVNYTSVLANTSEEHEYGDLAPDEVSEYQEHSQAYSYCYVELIIDGDTLFIQPLDFVGETPLEPGNYTYEIDYDGLGEPYGSLSIAVKED